MKLTMFNKPILLISAICLLTSCYTRKQAIRKFFVPTPINVDTTWKITGSVTDSAHTGTFFLNDSCDVLKRLYDSLIASGSYVVDTTVYIKDSVLPGIKDSTISPPRKPLSNKWAVIYKDSVVLVKFRLSKSGQFQFDVEKLQREIPFKADANFKGVFNSPCPDNTPTKWQLFWAGVQSFFSILGLLAIVLLLGYFFFKR
jgi:hypothetical protein